MILAGELFAQRQEKELRLPKIDNKPPSPVA